MELKLAPDNFRLLYEECGFDFSKAHGPDAQGEIKNVGLPAAIKGGRDKHPAVSVNVYTGVFNDHGGHGSGNIFQAIQKVHGLTGKDADDWIAARIGGDSSPVPIPVVRQEPAFTVAEALEWHQNLMSPEGAIARAYLCGDRLLEEETLIRYKIGLRYGHKVSDKRGRGIEGWWIVFPTKVEGDKVMCFKAFLFDPDNGCWKLLDGKKEADSKGSCLYPLKEAQRGGGVLYLCEGEIDMLTARQMGYNALTGTAGAGTWKPEWTREIAECNPEKVVIIYDPDKAGKEGREKVSAALTEAGLLVEFVDLPGDVNDTVREDPEIFRKAVESPVFTTPDDEDADRELEVVSALYYNPELLPIIKAVLPSGDAFQSAELGNAYRLLNEISDRVSFRHKAGKVVEKLEAHTPEFDYKYRIELLKQYAEKIRTESEIRRLRAALRRIDKQLTSCTSISDAKALAHQAIRESVREIGGHTVSSASAVNTVRLNLERWKRGELAEYETSGFTSINRAIGGYHRGKLIVFGADSGSGKSSFATQSAAGVAVKYARRGEEASVVIFSAEMDAYEIIQNAAAQMSCVNVRKLMDNTASERELERYNKALDELAAMNIYIDDNKNPTLDYVNAKLVEVGTVAPVKLAVFDYLELMDFQTKSSAKEEERVAGIANGIRVMAGDTGVPFLLLSQLNEEYVHSSNGPAYLPGKRGIRNSRRVFHEAYTVLLWHWPHHIYETYGIITSAGKDGAGSEYAYDISDPAKGHIIIAKHRQGGRGKLPFRFISEYTLFEDPEDKWNRPPAELNEDQYVF